MPTRSSKDHDFVTVAHRVVEQAIGEQLDGSPRYKPRTGQSTLPLNALAPYVPWKCRNSRPVVIGGQSQREPLGCALLPTLRATVILTIHGRKRPRRNMLGVNDLHVYARQSYR